MTKVWMSLLSAVTNDDGFPLLACWKAEIAEAWNMSAESFAGLTGRLAFCFTLGQCCCVALNAEAIAVKSHCTLKNSHLDIKVAAICTASFTPCRDVSLLFMPLNRLIGCPVLWVLLIGSYKTQSFISLAQALPLGSVLNESDKGVSCLNLICDFFRLENVSFVPKDKLFLREW